MIKPTVGRVVNFVPHKANDPRWDHRQPCVALIAYVYDDRHINVVWFDQTGESHTANQVRLLQDDDRKPEEGFFATWMDYQKGQAAKTEALEAKLADAHAFQQQNGN